MLSLSLCHRRGQFKIRFIQCTWWFYRCTWFTIGRGWFCKLSGPIPMLTARPVCSIPQSDWLVRWSDFLWWSISSGTLNDIDIRSSNDLFFFVFTIPQFQIDFLWFLLVFIHDTFISFFVNCQFFLFFPLCMFLFFGRLIFNTDVLLSLSDESAAIRWMIDGWARSFLSFPCSLLSPVGIGRCRRQAMVFTFHWRNTETRQTDNREQNTEREKDGIVDKKKSRQHTLTQGIRCLCSFSFDVAGTCLIQFFPFVWWLLWIFAFSFLAFDHMTSNAIFSCLFREVDVPTDELGIGRGYQFTSLSLSL